jgi:hypothetical protein
VPLPLLTSIAAVENVLMNCASVVVEKFEREAFQVVLKNFFGMWIEALIICMVEIHCLVNTKILMTTVSLWFYHGMPVKMGAFLALHKNWVVVVIVYWS